MPTLTWAQARKLAKQEERQVLFIVAGTLHRVRSITPDPGPRSPTRQSGRKKVR